LGLSLLIGYLGGAYELLEPTVLLVNLLGLVLLIHIFGQNPKNKFALST
jgi:hypothetical protein